MSAALELRVAVLERQNAGLRRLQAVLTKRREAIKAQLMVIAPDLSGGRYCGVYVLLAEGVPVYVGQSINVFARIAAHRGKSGLVDFDEVRIIWCDAGELNVAEKRLIEQLVPECNRAGVISQYLPRANMVGRATPAEHFGPEFLPHHAGRPRIHPLPVPVEA